MKEVWKDIPNYEGMYQVSNLGRVKSFRKSTNHRWDDEYILKPSKANNGYCQVTLYNNTIRHKYLVHRLVAEAFIPNPEKLPQVNHKDENPYNNSAENLEWCTAEYNNAYGTARVRTIDTKSHPVEQFTLSGKSIALYRSTRIAAELLGINKGTLKDAIIKGRPCNGYYWKYSKHTF
jgi:hypothetical protein